MADTFIQLPTDSSGKKLAARSRTQGPDTVYDQYVIAISQRVTTGVYNGHSGAQVVLAAAQTTTTNFFGLFNAGSATGAPGSQPQLIALRAIDFRSQHGSALATPTSPRIVMSRVTYTSALAGTVITPAKRDSTDATNYGSMRTAATATGLTVVAAATSWFPVAALTAVGSGTAGESDWEPMEIGQLILRPLEGIIFQQLDAGTTSDTRRFTMNLRWEEFYIPA